MFHDPNLIGLGRSSVSELKDLLLIYGLTTEDMRKALTIDANIGNQATPLVGESLDPVVHFITLNSNNFAPTLRRWRTYEARAHLERFALTSSLGKSRWGGSAHAESKLGTPDSSVFEQVSEQQREFGQVGIVSTLAQLASMPKFGDLKKREAYNRLTKLLLDGERSIWFGDPSLEPYMFRGIFYQMAQISNNPNIIDLKTTGLAGSRETYVAGGSLDTNDVRLRMKDGLQYGGIHNAFFCSPDEKIALSNDENSRQRWQKSVGANLAKGESRVEAGITVDQLDNPLGDPCDVVWSSWFQNGGRISARLMSAPNVPSNFHEEAPQQPTAVALAAAADGKLPATSFYYAVALINEKAEGPAKIQTAAVATTNSNGKVNLTVTHPSGVEKAHSYGIYRSTVAPSSANDHTPFYFLKEVAVAPGAVAGGTQVLVDDGTVIPGSRVACLVDESAMSLPELLSPTMRDLADVDNSHRFSIDWIFSPLAHDKCLREVQWKNIGGTAANP